MPVKLRDKDGRPFTPANPMPVKSESYLVSRSQPYKKALAINSTIDSFSALVATVTEPGSANTAAVFRVGKGLDTIQLNTMVVLPYGGNDTNETLNVKVVG